MRLSIVLAICFLGVVSANNFFEDFQNKSQEAFHNLEHFGQDFQQKLQDALKNLFGNHDAEKPVTVAKRDLASDSLALLNSLGDPAKFSQQLIKVLAQMALQGRKKRDISEDLKKIAEAGKEKTQEAIQKILAYFSSFKNGGSTTEASVALSKRDLASESLQLINSLGDPAKFAQQLLKVIGEMALQGRGKRDLASDSLALLNSLGDPAKFSQQLIKVLAQMALQGRKKRAANPLVLLNDLQDPAKFAQDLVKVLADMALQGRKKRDLAEDLKKFAEAGKQRAQDALKKIMDLFGSFKRPASDETSTEKTVSKRDVSEDLQKLASAGKEKVAAALKQLQSLFEQVKGQFNHDASSKTVTKRDIAESLKKMGQAARENAQAAMQNIKDAFASLFKGMKKPAPVEEVEEDSTEVSVAKRSLGEAFKGFGDAINNFYGMFRKPTKPVAPVAEDTTESS